MPRPKNQIKRHVRQDGEKQDFSVTQPQPPPRSSSTSSSFTIPHSPKPISCLRSCPPRQDSTMHPSEASKDPPAVLIFTHGASGTLSTPAVMHFTAGFSAALPMVAFQGSMNLGARVAAFGAVLQHERERSGNTPLGSLDADHAGGAGVALGGRSMGARAAVVAATERYGAGTKATATRDAIKLLILISYPLRSPSGDFRDQILLSLPPEVDVLFISGDKDSMCDLKTLRTVRMQMKAVSWMATVNGAGHGMDVKPKPATEAVGVETGRLAADWVRGREKAQTECEIWWDAEGGQVRRSAWREGRNGAEDRNMGDKASVEGQLLDTLVTSEKALVAGPRSQGKRRRTNCDGDTRSDRDLPESDGRKEVSVSGSAAEETRMVAGKHEKTERLLSSTKKMQASGEVAPHLPAGQSKARGWKRIHHNTAAAEDGGGGGGGVGTPAIRSSKRRKQVRGP